jgi:hypothetical protein
MSAGTRVSTPYGDGAYHSTIKLLKRRSIEVEETLFMVKLDDPSVLPGELCRFGMAALQPDEVQAVES